MSCESAFVSGAWGAWTESWQIAYKYAKYMRTKGLKSLKIEHSSPHAPCMPYLPTPTFGRFLGQMLVHVPYMEHVGTIKWGIFRCHLWPWFSRGFAHIETMDTGHMSKPSWDFDRSHNSNIRRISQNHLQYTKLVGGFNHLEKYWSMGRIMPYIMENKKCVKPPTSKPLDVRFFTTGLTHTGLQPIWD